jgi:iron(III) transport system permease protein
LLLGSLRDETSLLGHRNLNPNRRWGETLSHLLAGAPAAVLVAICSGLPLIWMACVLLGNPWVRHAFHPTAFRMELLGRTLLYNGSAGVIATAMGIPAAFVLGRGRGFASRILWVILPAALLMPSLSFAYGWAQLIRLLQDHVPLLYKMGITFYPTGPADVFRCIWSLATWLWAVPACLIGLSLRRLDSHVQQQAMLDGALRRVTFRQLAGPIIASVAIVTILATQEFAVYEPTGISVVATEVRMVFDTGVVSSIAMPITVSGFQGAGAKSPDQAQRAAAAIATLAPLLLITLVLALLAVWGAARTSAADELTLGQWPRVLDASPITLVITVLLVLLNIGVPVAALFISLTGGFSPTRIWGEFEPQVLGALQVAGEAAGVGLVIALFAAARWTPGMLALAGASFLVGGQLLAIALIRIYNRPFLDVGNWVYNTSIIAVCAYVARFGWLAVASGKSTWSRPWRELREIASIDGAGPLRAAFWVIWPIAWPTLLAGGLLVGALSLTEVPATVLLMPQDPQVLTPTLMFWVHMSHFDPMIEGSLLMMGIVLIPALAAVLLASLGLRIARKSLGR